MDYEAKAWKLTGWQKALASGKDFPPRKVVLIRPVKGVK
jgi:hypothetical protein